jgi:RHS repeat-associated protein
VLTRRYAWRTKIIAGAIAATLLAGITFAHWRAKRDEGLIANNIPKQVKNLPTASQRDVADIPPEAFAPQPPTAAGYNAHSGGMPPGALPPGVVLPGMQGGRTSAQGYGVSDGVRQQFTGKERDAETGLDYFGARYYSSAQGRFTSPDELQSTSAEFALLGKGHPTKQALPTADLTNPQSLNRYQYALNNPLRYVDPDGQKPQDRLEIEQRHDDEEFGRGRLSPEEYLARAKARGAGAVAGLAILIAARGGAAAFTAVSMWAARNPDSLQQVAQGLLEAGGGPPGLTLSPVSRLRAAEIDTGERLAKQLGVRLMESAHEGEEYVVAGAKTTIDAMGGERAFKYFGSVTDFFKSIVRHVNKSADYVAIDLKGASQNQVEAVEKFVGGLTEKQRNKIMYVR